MRCEIYGSPTSTHYTQIVGHIADDGNIYNSGTARRGAEDLRRCVGHIADDGNVYATAKGFGEAAGNCVGHIASDGNIYDVPPQLFRPDSATASATRRRTAGLYYAGRRFRRARPLRGAGAGRRARTGRGGAVAAFKAGRGGGRFPPLRGRERRFGRRRVRRRQFGRRPRRKRAGRDIAWCRKYTTARRENSCGRWPSALCSSRCSPASWATYFPTATPPSARALASARAWRWRAVHPP